MNRKSSLFVAALIIIAPATFADGLGHYGGQNTIRIHGGNFEPDGKSAYWQDKEVDFFAEAEDFDDFQFGVDWVHYVSARIGIIGTISGYEGSSLQSYREFVTADGRDIFHQTTLDLTNVELGVIFHLLSGDAVVLPYIGGGVGIYELSLSEDGDFVDFGFTPPALFNDLFLEEGEAFGTFFLVGVEVPIGSSWSVFGEAKWSDADDELTGDFAGLGPLDLSGQALSAGVSFSF